MTLTAQDLAVCDAAIRTGSRSFHAAGRLLPAHVRAPALALYAFCRAADDAIDEGADKAAALAALRDRLDAIYAGAPSPIAADRAFAGIVRAHAIPRALPEALLDGLAWDAEGRRHATLADLRAYSARVAASVGAMMCLIMGVRDRQALARACDLGVAMQLTNIARDVGEDARAGRLFLPTDWLADVGATPERVLRATGPDPVIAACVARLLREADHLYARSEAGIAALPARCRPAIFAARFIYAGIGGAVARAGHDSVTRRARTGGAQKVALLALAGLRSAATGVMPRSPLAFAPPLPETTFLVDAVAGPAAGRAAQDPIYAALAHLKARDLAGRVRPAPQAALRGATGLAS